MPESLARISLMVGDSFLIEAACQSFTEKIKKHHPGDLAQTAYRLSDTPLEKILPLARELPFFAAVQIFRIREAERVKKQDLETLEPYLSDPAPQTYLIFEADALDKDHFLVKSIESSGKIHWLKDTQKGGAVPRFIHDKLKQSGKTMTREALEKVAEEMGDYPALLDSVMDRLITYAGERTQITVEMADTFHEDLNDVSIFELTDAMASRHTGRSLEILQKIIADREIDVVAVIGMMHWQIRRLWKAKILQEEGQPEAAILKKCRVFYANQARPFMRQVGMFSRRQLEAALEGLFELDWKLKTGRVDGGHALDAWLVKTTGDPAPAGRMNRS